LHENDNAWQSVHMIDSLLQELYSIGISVVETNEHAAAFEALRQWRSRAVQELSGSVGRAKAAKLENIGPRSTLRDLVGLVLDYQAHLLSLRRRLEGWLEGVGGRGGGVGGAGSTEAVLVVHGRDEAAKDSVVRFLDALRLKPVVLHDQPDTGRSMMQNLESHAADAGIGFAIVVLGADDLATEASRVMGVRPRAQQSVVFELGYLIGRLGTRRVRALYSGEVELPSYYQGILYTKLDTAGAWRWEMAREMKAAGVGIDPDALSG